MIPSKNPYSTYKNIFNQHQEEQSYQLLKHIVSTVYKMFEYSKDNQVDGYVFKQLFIQHESSSSYVELWFLFEKDKKLDIFIPDKKIMDDTVFITLSELRNLFLGSDSKMTTITFINHLNKNLQAKSLTEGNNKVNELKKFLGDIFFARYEKEELENNITVVNKSDKPISLTHNKKAKI